MVKRKPEPYASEAEMCAQFISEIGPDWTAYPETAGWDILLVRRDGVQIGIEAKLRLNGLVIAQALEGPWPCDEHPDFRAVLVPAYARGNLETVAAHVGLTVITISKPAPCEGLYYGRCRFTPRLPFLGHNDIWSESGWYDMCPNQRLSLPEYVPDVAAGVPSPLRLTPWKIAAIRIAITIDRRGFVTRADFKALRIDIRRWLPREGGWLQVAEPGFVAGPHLPDFRRQHPDAWERIAADYETWKLPAVPLARQGALL